DGCSSDLEELPLRAVVGHRGVVPGVERDGRDPGDRMVEPGGDRPRALLEVRGEDVVGGADPEEVVHIDVAGVVLGAAFGEQRDRVDAAGPGGGGDARAAAAEPQLEGEGGAPKPRRAAEGDVLV